MDNFVLQFRKFYTVKKAPVTLLFLLTAFTLTAQKLRKEDKQTLANLQKHIRYLASDSLEGRRAGTNGERLAAAYIGNAFRAEGLMPKGDDGYFQPFEIDEGRQVDPSTSLSINGRQLVLYKDYFPLVFSAGGTIKGAASVAMQEVNTPWFYDLKEILEERAGNPHFDLNEAILQKVKDAKKKGATALFLFNTSGTEDGLRFDGRDRTASVSIPVVYLTKDAVKKYFSDEAATLDIHLTTSLSEKRRTAENVVAYIDNGAPSTVVLGAHFDHLGYGEDHNALDNVHEVHNGADDNASGTAALIEMARILKNSRLRHNNYLLIAFSGEELGLFGSRYFTEHPTIALASVNYMINMDMLGRLSDSTHALIVGGYGTSPFWGMAYHQTGRSRLYDGDLSFRFDSSGIGPSDHTSFYLHNIPVLFYFTGLHADYHKASDDEDKINYGGELSVIKHIYSMVEAADKQNARLAFSKTREPNNMGAPKFSVTLGIMPDYTFSGQGVRVDGVSQDRPAQKAGLQAGDIITELGAYKVTSMETYMEALSKFRKGDKTKVVYSRGTQTLSSPVEFQ